MTKEQIKQEAEEYAKNLAFVYETDIVQRIVRERVRLALIDVLEQGENRIEELTEQNTSLLTSVENLNKSVQELEEKLEQTEKDLADYQFNYPTITELEETNNELKGKLLLSDMVLADKTKRIKELENKLMDKVTLESLDVVSAKIKALEKKNAELELKLEALDEQTPWKDIKDKSELIGQLTKAKELLAKWVEYFKPKGGNIPPTPIQVDTEQFLNSEVEK